MNRDANKSIIPLIAVAVLAVCLLFPPVQMVRYRADPVPDGFQFLGAINRAQRIDYPQWLVQFMAISVCAYLVTRKVRD